MSKPNLIPGMKRVGACRAAKSKFYKNLTKKQVKQDAKFKKLRREERTSNRRDDDSTNT